MQCLQKCVIYTFYFMQQYVSFCVMNYYNYIEKRVCETTLNVLTIRPHTNHAYNTECTLTHAGTTDQYRI